MMPEAWIPVLRGDIGWRACETDWSSGEEQNYVAILGLGCKVLGKKRKERMSKIFSFCDTLAQLKKAPRTLLCFFLEKHTWMHFYICYSKTLTFGWMCHQLSLPSSFADVLIITTRIGKMAGLSSLFSLYRTESFT